MQVMTSYADKFEGVPNFFEGIPNFCLRIDKKKIFKLLLLLLNFKKDSSCEPTYKILLLYYE